MIIFSMKLELKQKARELRINGLSIKKIAKQLKVSSSSVSIWVRDIILTHEQKYEIESASNVSMKQRDLQRVKIFTDKRSAYQDKGKKRIKENDPLYVAGCMLYWGEGSKNRNTVCFTNSDLYMLLIFKKFLEDCFCCKQKDFAVSVNCYTDLRPLEEIEEFWISKLNIERSNLKKTTVNNLPKSSKLKQSKLEYGTVRICVYNTSIVQEIFGAIQGFGNFENKKWLR